MSPTPSAVEPIPVMDISALLTDDQITAGLAGRATPIHWDLEETRFMAAPGRRWRLAVRRTASGAVLPLSCDGGQFPGLGEQTRERLKEFAARVLPDADPQLTAREILARRGYEVIWVEQRL